MALGRGMLIFGNKTASLKLGDVLPCNEEWGVFRTEFIQKVISISIICEVLFDLLL